MQRLSDMLREKQQFVNESIGADQLAGLMRSGDQWTKDLIRLHATWDKRQGAALASMTNSMFYETTWDAKTRNIWGQLANLPDYEAFVKAQAGDKYYRRGYSTMEAFIVKDGQIIAKICNQDDRGNPFVIASRLKVPKRDSYWNLLDQLSSLGGTYTLLVYMVSAIPTRSQVNDQESEAQKSARKAGYESGAVQYGGRKLGPSADGGSKMSRAYDLMNAKSVYLEEELQPELADIFLKAWPELKPNEVRVTVDKTYFSQGNIAVKLQIDPWDSKKPAPRVNAEYGNGEFQITYISLRGETTAAVLEKISKAIRAAEALIAKVRPKMDELNKLKAMTRLPSKTTV